MLATTCLIAVSSRVNLRTVISRTPSHSMALPHLQIRPSQKPRSGGVRRFSDCEAGRKRFADTAKLGRLRAWRQPLSRNMRIVAQFWFRARQTQANSRLSTATYLGGVNAY